MNKSVVLPQKMEIEISECIFVVVVVVVVVDVVSTSPLHCFNVWALDSLADFHIRTMNLTLDAYTSYQVD